MLYVAIDQHAKQITVAISNEQNEQGEDVLKRQVSTRPEKINEFFDRLVALDSEFMAILESCGATSKGPTAGIRGDECSWFLRSARIPQRSPA